MMKQVLVLLTVLFSATFSYAQSGSVKGRLIDGENGEGVFGASVLVVGTTKGAISDFDGNFKVDGLSGDVTIRITYLGYATIEIERNVTGEVDLGELTLEPTSIGLDQIEVVASVAVDRKTPVASSSIKALEIAERASNQEFPELLKSTPGVYATKAGGGFGDAQTRIRGFNSENVAVLINGVPVNDMENGRVYWSNWAGLTDVTSQMQVQRGLGASKVAVPSIGGTINVLTKTTDTEKGGNIAYSFGNNGYQKTSFALSTGLSETGWAVSLSGAKTSGDGYVDGTWFEGYNYFFNVTKQINDSHILSLTGFGAPQKHGQRQNRTTIENWQNAPNPLTFNYDYGIYQGEIKSVEDNFYHKPQFSLNHYWTINERSELSTVAYASIGTGGGGGNLGFNNFNAPRIAGQYSPIDFDALVAMNEENVDGSASVALRASRNDHKWYGVLSTYSNELNDNLTLLVGADLRWYKGIHFQEITDLLGAEYYIDNSDVNNPNNAVRTGDKYGYYNDGVVNWTGAFGQLEYSKDDLSLFFSGAVSNTGYKRIDYFTYTPDQQESETLNFIGFQTKGGANYNLDARQNIFANIGYFEKAPIFDNAFVNFSNDVNEDAVNEKIFSVELGYGYRTTNFNVNVNLYRTQWIDRAFLRSLQGSNGEDFTANLTGVNAIHQGAEVEFSYKPSGALLFKGMISMGDWQWENDLENVQVFDQDQNLIEEFDLKIAGLKVGDAAQTTAALTGEYRLLPEFKISVDFNYYANLYASFDPLSRRGDVGSAAAPQAWKVPEWTTFDLRLKYDFKIGDFDASLFGNVNNVFDTEYIADANDGANHDAATAVVWYAQGRTWTGGIRLNF
ncbi:TonB-dependent receptor [Roseivirga pacifica]|uniref:TonB-dependent receptor n=1 Tax=Roseivirga pacifica TaxID=1267423 RepID=UPI0020951CD9|nr:TonB-dependent receptor [Roseivirga pacifica]